MINLASDTDYQLLEIINQLRDKSEQQDVIGEVYDFLALLKGIKPVFLLGRTPMPKELIEKILKLALDLKLFVIEGCLWDATAYGQFPKWYTEYCRGQMSEFKAWYICREEQFAMSIEKIIDLGGILSMDEEARLLGYPVCCVNAHYNRAHRYHRGSLSILKRLAKGNEQVMQELAMGNAQLAPKTNEEIEDFDFAFQIQTPHLGSWNMCDECKNGINSSSNELEKKYLSVIEKFLKLNSMQ